MQPEDLSSVQSLSHVQLFVTPWVAAYQASLSITISQSSLRLTSIESAMPSSHLIERLLLNYDAGIFGLVFVDCIELLHLWLQRI